MWTFYDKISRYWFQIKHISLLIQNCNRTGYKFSNALCTAFFSRSAVICMVLGFITLLSMILVAIFKSKQRNLAMKPSGNMPGTFNSFDILLIFCLLLILSHLSLCPLSVPPKLVVLHMDMAIHTFDDIMRVTENLSEKYVVGYGASSTVYKCVLKNSRPLAIKRLYSQYLNNSLEFETELNTIGSIRHRNIVSLHGYALSPHGNLLFYDLMENGSLWDLLHG